MRTAAAATLLFLSGPGAFAIGMTARSVFNGPGPIIFIFLTIYLASWFALMLALIVALALKKKAMLCFSAIASLAALLCIFFYLPDIGDYGHLGLMYRQYMGAVHREKESAEIAFEWGDAAVMATDAIQIETLVYDRSGEEATRVGRVLDDAKGTGLKIATKHLFGKFYLVTRFSP